MPPIPPAPPGSAAQQALWPLIYNTAVNTYGDSSLAYTGYALMQTEGLYSNGAWQPNQGTNGNPGSGAQGPFQLLPSTANAYGLPNAVDPTSGTFIPDNVTAGMKDLVVKINAAGGNIPAAIQAYKGAKSDKGKQSIQPAVNKIMSSPGVPGSITPPQSQKTPEDASFNRAAANYAPLTDNGDYVSDETYDSLFPEIVVTDGLGNTPWYSDAGLITGNPRVRKEVQPVTFKVYLGENADRFSLASNGRTGTPIEIQLNASMKSYSVAQKHLFHQQRTRTAFHITMWGMQADMIEGTCSTGVFMNQLGLTDYFSTFSADDRLKQLVGLGDADGYEILMQALSKSNPNFKEANAFRVAAQDAFQEFLSLFKMNGTVWLYTEKPYQVTVGDWTGIQAWSPALGINSTQIGGHNNDVVTRGTVVMQLRNFCYEGYFKSLQWTMSADKPFSWDFNFTFQVERTVGRDYVPGT